MNTTNLAKISFIGLETVSLFGVILLSCTDSSWVNSMLIILFAIIAVWTQKEQQKIKWDENDETDSQIQMYIDMKADEGR